MTVEELVSKFLTEGPFNTVYQDTAVVVVNVQVLPGGVDVTLRNDWGADWVVGAEELTEETSHA